jgi:hypothetical protein
MLFADSPEHRVHLRIVSVVAPNSDARAAASRDPFGGVFDGPRPSQGGRLSAHGRGSSVFDLLTSESGRTSDSADVRSMADRSLTTSVAARYPALPHDLPGR